jgi:hypothetical protein
MVAKGVPQQVKIMHRIDVLEQVHTDNTATLMSRLDKVPEELTKCMLERFQVNGAQPLLETRVQDMISSANNLLRDVLLSEIRRMRTDNSNDAGEQGDSSVNNEQWPPGTLGPNGYMQWTWGGRLHPVPQGWHLPKGNVSMLFNLWVKGNPAMGIRPCRFLKSWDLVPLEERANLPLVLSAQGRADALSRTARTWKAYLSQAHDVMLVIQDGIGKSWQALESLPATERECAFIASFTAMSERMHPDISDEKRDALRVNEMSYLSTYSKLSKRKMLRTSLGKRKKTQRDPEEENEDENVSEDER